MKVSIQLAFNFIYMLITVHQRVKTSRIEIEIEGTNCTQTYQFFKFNFPIKHGIACEFHSSVLNMLVHRFVPVFEIDN